MRALFRRCLNPHYLHRPQPLSRTGLLRLCSKLRNLIGDWWAQVSRTRHFSFRPRLHNPLACLPSIVCGLATHTVYPNLTGRNVSSATSCTPVQRLMLITASPLPGRGCITQVQSLGRRDVGVTQRGPSSTVGCTAGSPVPLCMTPCWRRHQLVLQPCRMQAACT